MENFPQFPLELYYLEWFQSVCFRIQKLCFKNHIKAFKSKSENDYLVFSNLRFERFRLITVFE